MSVLRQKRPRSIARSRFLQRWRSQAAAHYFAARKARQPSDDALMRSGPRLRKFCITKIADLLIAKFSAYAAATVRRYNKSGLALILLRSRCVLR